MALASQQNLQQVLLIAGGTSSVGEHMESIQQFTVERCLLKDEPLQ
jgi:hypothetical protein